MSATIERDETTTATEGEAATTAAATEPDVKLLGYAISWNVRDTEIERDEMARRLEAAGFKESLPKEPTSGKKALRRAIAAWASKRGGEPIEDDEVGGRRSLIREIRGKAEPGQAAPVTFGLVEESQLTRRLSLSYATNLRFHYRPGLNGEDGTLAVTSTADGPIAEGERKEIAEQILPLWAKYKRTFTAADVSHIVGSIVRGLDPVAVPLGAGHFHVPATHAPVVERLEALVAALPSDGDAPSLRAYEQVDWPRTRASLRAAIMDDLLREVREAEARVRGLEEREGEKPGTVKRGTIKELLESFLAVKKRAEAYQDSIDLRGARVAESLDALGQRAFALAKLSGENQARAARQEMDSLVAAATAGDEGDERRAARREA